jgi:error-prone DNA polymerase
MSGPADVIDFPKRLQKREEASSDPAYAELVAATNFSFLRGASNGQDMVLQALELDYGGLGIADRNTVSGVVRAWWALKRIRKDGLPVPTRVREGGSPGETTWVDHPEQERLKAKSALLKERAKKFKLCVGARLAFMDGTPDVVAYPVNREGWGRLCRILTNGNLRAPPNRERGVKGECRLFLRDLLDLARDLLLIVIPDEKLDGVESVLQALRACGPTWLGATMHRRGDDERRLARLKRLAAKTGVRLLAVNDALYHDAGERDLHDVMTCIREGIRLTEAGRLLEANAERYLKPSSEMVRLFRSAPEAIAETKVFVRLMEFDLEQLRYEYPQEPVPAGWTDQEYLEDRVWFHAGMKYKWRTPKKVKRLLRKELAFIKKRRMATYFLTLFDMVRVAEDKGILCQGRGSAANSAVCYVLGITSVNPATFDVLFERFLSNEREEPPDIDVDFEHERREEIIQHIYRRYGHHRAGIAATVIHYRPRSAMREVGKVFGLTDDVTARLSGLVWGSWGDQPAEKQLRQAGLDPDNPVLRRALRFSNRLLGFPRHLSQHVGGFVLTQGRLDEIVPIGNAAMDNRTFIEWDKDDIDALGLMKVDVLALGMLTCIRKARDLLYLHGGKRYGLRDFPLEDSRVYDMLCKGESIGVFQVESRAQINMLPRMKPKKIYDLVIEVAIVRPGPIQGNMVHPYLKRRNGEETVVFPSPSPECGEPDELYKVLNKTLGVPLFQEQAMKLAMVAAKFTSEEANGLRRAMATFRNVGTIHEFKDLMVERMVARGYAREFAERCFAQIEGFGSYGFPESHAAAFAQLVYVSAWLKCHHPAAFACALLNSQPMGFYAPAQLIGDAQKNGVEVRPVDVNFSAYDNTLERRGDGALALRLGFRQVDGMREEDANALVAHRGAGYASVTDMRERGRVSAPMLRRLADADAFRSLSQDRRAALWDVRRLPDDDLLPLFAHAQARELGEEPESHLPDMPLGEHVAADFETTRVSLKAHPMQILRPVFVAERILSCQQTSELKDGRWTRTAGIVLVRQRPGTGNAIFITLEDETGITNALLWARTFEKFRAEVMGARLLVIEGRVQKSKEGVVHLMAARVFDRTAELQRLSDDHVVEPELTRADEIKHPQHPRGPKGPDGMFRHPRNVRILPKSRDFH